MTRRRAVFLDRDGVIIKDKGFVHRVEDVEFIPGAVEAIRQLHDHGFLVVVVTNQSGIGRGYYTEQDFLRVTDFINKELVRAGTRIDATYFCPHHPTEGIGPYRVECECRKPKSGMLRRAAQELNIDLRGSFMVGDRDVDVLAGLGAGVRPIHIATGLAPVTGTALCSQAPNLAAAVSIICKNVYTLEYHLPRREERLTIGWEGVVFK